MTTRFQMSFPDDLLDASKREAKRNGQSLAAFVRLAIVERLRKSAKSGFVCEFVGPADQDLVEFIKKQLSAKDGIESGEAG